MAAESALAIANDMAAYRSVFASPDKAVARDGGRDHWWLSPGIPCYDVSRGSHGIMRCCNRRWDSPDARSFRVDDDPSSDSQTKNWQPHKRRCTTFNKVLRDRGARTHKLGVLLQDRALQPQMCHRSGQSPLPKRNSRGAAVSREDGRLVPCHGSSRRERPKRGQSRVSVGRE